ncbi:hypothetical protein GCM10010421_00990 [Streptomyces glaucus]|uniref:Uncharacterized protein n=1 Tax=Streptomyces glaucus TaxID=284029 RepID=A0ABN3J2R6_9ACTN
MGDLSCLRFFACCIPELLPEGRNFSAQGYAAVAVIGVCPLMEFDEFGQADAYAVLAASVSTGRPVDVLKSLQAGDRLPAQEPRQ